MLSLRFVSLIFFVLGSASAAHAIEGAYKGPVRYSLNGTNYPCKQIVISVRSFVAEGGQDSVEFQSLTESCWNDVAGPKVDPLVFAVQGSELFLAGQKVGAVKAKAFQFRVAGTDGQLIEVSLRETPFGLWVSQSLSNGRGQNIRLKALTTNRY